MKKLFYCFLFCVVLTLFVGCSDRTNASMSKKDTVVFSTGESFDSTLNQPTQSEFLSSTSPSQMFVEAREDSSIQYTEDDDSEISSSELNGYVEVTTQPRETVCDEIQKSSEVQFIEDNDNMNEDYRLIVNGKDIANNYVYIDKTYEDAEIPLTLILRELGATVEWKNQNVTISFDGNKYVLDIAKSDFGLPRPPGSTYYVRKVYDEEIVVDSTSATGLITKWMGAFIEIDFYKNTIVIG